MTSMTIDRFARRLARQISRRRVVAIAFGAGAAASIGVNGDARAATRCRAVQQTCTRDHQCCSGACATGRDVPLRDRHRCACDHGATVCNGRCVTTRSDARHCGACGVKCQAGAICNRGACIEPGPCVAAAKPGYRCEETPEGEAFNVPNTGCILYFSGMDCSTSAECPMESFNLDATWVCAIRVHNGSEYTFVAPVGGGMCVGWYPDACGIGDD